MSTDEIWFFYLRKKQSNFFLLYYGIRVSIHIWISARKQVAQKSPWWDRRSKHTLRVQRLPEDCSCCVKSMLVWFRRSSDDEFYSVPSLCCSVDLLMMKAELCEFYGVPLLRCSVELPMQVPIDVYFYYVTITRCTFSFWITSVRSY
jgi:hypothetical protein